ncbi:MAG: MBL fold metallo-hydrolase, partial [Acidimicrobiia bacterium]
MEDNSGTAPIMTFVGGAGTVTGSKTVIETGQARLLVDCGLFQGRKELRKRNWANFPVPPELIDAVVLT